MPTSKSTSEKIMESSPLFGRGESPVESDEKFSRDLRTGMPNVVVSNVTEDSSLGLTLYELNLHDSLNNCTYGVALIATRRGLTFNVTKKKKTS